MTAQQAFLLIAAAGLTPIALSYGAVPGTSLPYLFGLTVDGVNVTHIFRAIMGLYLALVVYWIVGAFNDDLTAPALWSLVVFMLGLAAGRAVSLLLDGIPHWLLIGYLLAEIAFGIVGLRLLNVRKSSRRNDCAPNADA